MRPKPASYGDETRMAQQFADRQQVDSRFEHARGVRVAQGVRRDGFADSGHRRRHLAGSLDRGRREGANGLIEGTPGRFFLVDQVNLVLADLIEPQFFGHLAKVGAEFIDMPGVGVDGAGGEIANLHVFCHAVDVGVTAAIIGCHGFDSSEQVKF